MAFGDVIRSAAAPTFLPLGIGGDDNTIWHCSDFANAVYELNTSDLSTKRSAGSPTATPQGIGGDSNTIWYCDSVTDNIYKLSTTDFSVIRNGASPSSAPTGVGGDNSTIWHCDFDSDLVYELKTTDFSVIQFAASPSSEPQGIGGDSNTVWHCDDNLNNVYKLSTTDLSVVSTASSPTSGPTGIGGDGSTIWHCEKFSNKVYELSTGTYIISGNVKDEDGNNLNGVTVSFENTLSYSTSTNPSGNYSQVVNPDVYTVTASLTGYISSSASVDASAGDQTQNFVLAKPVVSGNVKDEWGNLLRDVSISLENTQSYDITTDENGEYSQSVYVDTYTFTVSKSPFITYTEDIAISVDATHNFILESKKETGMRSVKRWSMGASIIGGILCGARKR